MPKTKFKPSGKQCNFVGYSAESKAYLVYDKTIDKILLTRNVIFNEKHYPATKAEQVVETTESGNHQKTITLFEDIFPEENTNVRRGTPRSPQERETEPILSEMSETDHEDDDQLPTASQDVDATTSTIHEDPGMIQGNEQPMQRTRSQRTVRLPARLHDYCLIANANEVEEDPSCMAEAMKSQNKQEL